MGIDYEQQSGPIISALSIKKEVSIDSRLLKMF